MFDIDRILKPLQPDPHARRQAASGALAGAAGHRAAVAEPTGTAF